MAMVLLCATGYSRGVPDIFDVIADETRRDILAVLLEAKSMKGRAGANGESSVSDIVTALGINQPTVSKHLKVLRESGLVTVREDGQHRYYSIETNPLEDVQDWLIPYLGGDVVAKDAATLAAVGLDPDQRAFAESLGKRVADVTNAVRQPVSWLKRDGGSISTGYN